MADAITLETLDLLPDLERFQELCKVVAMLDAIIEPEWQYRYFSFNSKWDEAEEMASMRDGCGSDHHCLFTADGAILKGFDHESHLEEQVIETGKPPSWVFENVPSEFRSFLEEPAFRIDQTTFCIWRLRSDQAWCSGTPGDEQVRKIPLGSLQMLQDDPRIYHQWATAYYEKDFPIETIEAVYRMEPISAAMITELNEHLSLDDLEGDIKGIGYPAKW